MSRAEISAESAVDGISFLEEHRVKYCKKDQTHFTIPKRIGGKVVTSIDNYAFRGCSRLTSIVLPYNITSIGDNAFNGCAVLTTVSFPDSVTSIGDDAFNGCTGLTSIFLPDSITSIGDGAFNGCTGLASVVFTESLTSIGVDTFNGCTRLTSIVLPDSITNIGDDAFNRCTGLTAVFFPESLTSIGDDAFYDCYRLTSFILPKRITSIGNRTFDRCSGLTSIVLPDSITSIGDDAFNGCTGLRSVVLPKSVTSIGGGAFDECSGLTSLTLPACVIDMNSFPTTLSSVEFSASLRTLLGYNHFVYNINPLFVAFDCIFQFLSIPELTRMTRVSKCFYSTIVVRLRHDFLFERVGPSNTTLKEDSSSNDSSNELRVRVNYEDESEFYEDESELNAALQARSQDELCFYANVNGGVTSAMYPTGFLEIPAIYQY